jgi:hypothetical protein
VAEGRELSRELKKKMKSSLCRVKSPGGVRKRYGRSRHKHSGGRMGAAAAAGRRGDKGDDLSRPVAVTWLWR